MALPGWKIHKLIRSDGTKPKFNRAFWCPGCKRGHVFSTKGKEPVWEFNDDYVNPTISPSILVNKSTPERRCHLHIKNGKITYCDDCWHDLKNQTVEMEEF